MRDQPGWTVSLGRWKDVQMRLHLFVLLLVVCTLYLSWLGGQSGDEQGLIWIAVIGLLVLTASIAVHVIGHLYAAMQLDERVDTVVLGPLGDFAGRASEGDPRNELLIAAAGPAMNFLLALACAANVGSAATLIGNPQNMLIGETLRLPFLGYIREVAAPVALGLVLTWAVIAWQARGRWEIATGGGAAAGYPPGDAPPAFDRWQSAKGVAVAGIVFVLFLFAPLPREVVALVAAGLLMTSRKLHSFKMLGLVDWQLLVLFIGLFVVNHALARTGVPVHTIQDLAAAGVDLQHPGLLFAAAFVLSNIVSNVPAVMLLLPAADHEIAGPVLALSSTLAGNLLIVGSIANIIVVDAAQRRNIRIGWYEHARIGIPVTVATMTVAAGWLWLRLGAL